MGAPAPVPHEQDPHLLRLSDAERDRVAEVLRDASAAGRLGPEELDERLEAAWAARTYADLTPILADLPADERTPRPPTPRAGASAVAGGGHPVPKSTTVMGSVKRKGQWVLGAKHSAVAVMGDVLLDLREADLTAPETVITATSVLGSVKILVDEFTEVIVEGTSLMGDFRQARDKVPAQLDRDCAVVRIRGTALMGDVVVQRLPMPGTPRKFLGRF